MINGFLHAENRKIVDGSGREILLKGWGLGNWLLQEGYMWLAEGERFDRPSRIERTVEELTGVEYARDFWNRYRENYIRREDILKMAELGYNSVRIPFHYKLFMTDGEEIKWKEEGFRLLDRCLSWCEEAGIYAFLDLHGAPGGQTGSNIDDSADNVPRLFLEERNQEKCIALWAELARRYRDRAVVGGYDLLNEPIVPPAAGFGDFDSLIPKLCELYKKLVAAVRQVDSCHMLSIEGAHWATDTSVFDRRYDENMVLHFHRYGEMPDIRCLRKFMDAAEKIQTPLWMGETGENVNEWYAAFYPLAHSLGIGYNLWPWKKMECTNSPYSIRKPKGYQEILDYIAGGSKPDGKAAREIFDAYLENIKMENCVENRAVTNHVLRQGMFSLRATDFDECPGAGNSFSGICQGEQCTDYRGDCHMRLVELSPPGPKRFVFDSGWDRFGLVLGKDEFACYSVDTAEAFSLEILVAEGYAGGVLAVGREGQEEIAAIAASDCRVHIPIQAGTQRIKIRVEEGEICLVKLLFGAKTF